jgi:hypothetical protein
MNKLDRIIINHGKKILINTVLDEIAKYKAKLAALENVDTLKIDIFHTGLLLDVRKTQRKGIEAIEKKLLELKNRSKKEHKTG